MDGRLGVASGNSYLCCPDGAREGGSSTSYGISPGVKVVVVCTVNCVCAVAELKFLCTWRVEVVWRACDIGASSCSPDWPGSC